MNLIEAQRIADGLGLTWDQFLDKYVDQRWPGEESFLLRQINGVCVFLRNESDQKCTCMIHHFKPSACLEWTASVCRPECQEGLARYWGLTVGQTGQLSGPKEKLGDFISFLSTCPVIQTGFAPRSYNFQTYR
ncbi:MAG: YkgJ family cysteine cluster protein [Dehalococcoidia bacterium]